MNLKNRALALAFVALSASLSSQCAMADTSADGEYDKPVHSPDHKHLAFIHASGKTVGSGQGDVPADVVWYGTTKKDAAPLFDAGAKVDTHQKIGVIDLGNISYLQYSPDGKTIYFTCACYAVSNAVIALDLTTKKMKYVVDANSLKVIQTGKHKGDLVITRHRYHDGGGSYEKEETIKPTQSHL